jgi:RimJ/RimL family protein N-acetyltransferase
MGNPRDVQVALWVALGHEGRGIGKWIVTVLEWYAFYVFGYDHVYYQHDSSNRKSGILPKKLGYNYSHSFESERTAMKESGFWFSWKKQRPQGLSPGLIDTGDWRKWEEISLPWTSQI